MYKSYFWSYNESLIVCVYFEHWGVLSAGRGWPQALRVCCDTYAWKILANIPTPVDGDKSIDSLAIKTP